MRESSRRWSGTSPDHRQMKIISRDDQTRQFIDCSVYPDISDTLKKRISRPLFDRFDDYFLIFLTPKKRTMSVPGGMDNGIASNVFVRTKTKLYLWEGHPSNPWRCLWPSWRLSSTLTSERDLKPTRNDHQTSQIINLERIRSLVSIRSPSRTVKTGHNSVQ